ncbi:hypothetical protein QAD02_023960 [Eretmocerus hayati]|uniref:Uncharacterized protein n=1 Tax=Eretmocerus hayati TaxID=131215 RepID=A0ACC2PX34_9HYME|nr:hypothetical protein QAD02_023960 [Eretmocerus hayati]
MDSIMENPTESYAVYNNIVRFCYAVSKNEEDEMIKILKEGFNINSMIPHFNPMRYVAPDLIGSTAAHYAFSQDPNSRIPFNDSKIFVTNGSDFTLKNGSGLTVLHVSIEKILHPFMSVMTSGFRGLKEALSVHIQHEIKYNPASNYGLTHLHIACMISHLEAIEYFLKIDSSSINEVILQNSPFLAGYSALHLAAYFGTYETVECLLNHGADIHWQDADGLTPFQLIFERLEMVCKDYNPKYGSVTKKFKEDTSKILVLFINKSCADVNLAHQLCIACIEQSSPITEKLLKSDVDVNAKVTTLEMTALHFAAYFNFNITMQLLKYGANIFAKDIRGRTPLDICIARYGCRSICLLPSINLLKNHIFCQNFTIRVLSTIFLDDGKLRGLENVQSHPDMNTSCISFGSPIWPGYTPLHLAVTFSESQFPKPEFGCWYYSLSEPNGCRIIKYLISCGADVTRQDANGQTPLHLAFQLKKKDVMSLILNEYSNFNNNPVSASGLSHFHIACIMGNIDAMKKFIAKKVRVNCGVLSDFEVNHEIDETAIPGSSIVFKTGTTPLHIAVRMKKFDIVKLLVEHGADVKLKDADGMTPVHMMAYDEYSATNLLKMMNCLMHYILMVENFAEYCKSLEVIFKQINPIVISTLLQFEAISKTSMAISEPGPDAMIKVKSYFKNLKILKLMIDNHVKDRHITVDHLLDAFRCTGMEDKIPKRLRIETTASLLSLDWKSLGVLDSRSGMSQLHVACAINKMDIVKTLLESGADVNCKLSADSPVFPGYSPLHIAIEFSHHEKPDEEFTDLIELLLKCGADPTVQDVKDQTPLHLAYKYDERAIMTILLQSDKIFVSNPVNQLALSHFHIACSQNSIEAVEKFILSGVDVNACNYLLHLILWRREEEYMKNCGCTPIQMATCPKVIELLLSHGADPNLQDYRGWNALHYACKRDGNNDAIKLLITSGKVNINATTVKDLTALNLYVKKLRYESDQQDHDVIRLFLQHGAIIKNNTFKNALDSDSGDVFEVLLECGPDAVSITEGEDNVFHELFQGYSFETSDCIKHIQRLSKLGFDIDSQDSSGKTPLHVAFEQSEGDGVIALLSCGADVNILDHKGRIAFDPGLDESAIKFYVRHIEKLEIFERPVSPLVRTNMILTRNRVYGPDINIPERQRGYLEHEELTKIGGISLSGNLSLYEFLFMKPSQLLKLADDKKLIEIRDSPDFYETFAEFGGVLKYQMRVAERERLLHFARKSMHVLFKSKLPELCIQHIVVHLKNHDLTSLTTIK